MGVFGVYGVKKAGSVIYYGLHLLQHRGQEGAGIATFSEDGVCHHHRGIGLVNDIFDAAKLAERDDSIGLGGTLYAGGVKAGLDNVQPLVFSHKSGDFAIVGDGSFVNGRQIRDYLENRGCIFQTDTDAELLANLIKKQASEDRINSIISALNMVEGGFAFVIMTKNRIYACRDKFGIKPLCIGKLGDGYVVSSESCAFDFIGAEMVRDVKPGEVVTIDYHGLRSRQYSQFHKNMMCAMEYIYLARPDSDIDGCNVHAFRKEAGRRLFRECPADADIVVGVPDSSLSAASGYAEESGLPYEMGLIKNRYVTRTFIMPRQDMREKVVHIKLAAVRSIVKDKRIVLVDDSIVRGTTCLQIVNMLRDAGAKEVHVRIASPMMTHPCFYGVDTTTPDQLLCSTRTLEEARIAIGADSLGYLSHESTRASSFGCSELCLACFNGEYPTALYQYDYEQDE
ncbi:MAG: amidophosphoribosyltransferase [Bacteroidales bacterium]|nr:amidophosphoribosyltransferase [Bacteroidales bacterium]